MKISIIGSIAHEAGMIEMADQLRDHGYEVTRPTRGELDDSNLAYRKQLIDDYFTEIDTADAVLVFNETKHGIDGYIGGNTLMEITHAYTAGAALFIFNPISEQLSYAVEVEALEPTHLNGDITLLYDYIDHLPRLHLSSQSPVKLTAISRAMRRAGRPIVPVGYKTISGVNEQPMSVDEAYQGATNRHAHLHELVEVEAQPGDYFATVECGTDKFHAELGTYGCEIVIIEQVGGEKKYGLDVDIEIPKEYFDLVPSQYPDFGVMVQEKFGSTLKDPYSYITHGRISRAELVENAVYRVAVQL